MSLPVSLSRFRGALLGALAGDCLGSVFEGMDRVSFGSVCDFLKEVDRGDRVDDDLTYTDDTAMARCLVQSLLDKPEFNADDLAQRFTNEYLTDPDRGYGMAVVVVFKKLGCGQYVNVFSPAKEQFNGKGSFGNGAAMRVVGVPLAYPTVQDIIKPYSFQCASLPINISKAAVFLHLGNGIAALESVPTAIYSFLRYMEPVDELPKEYNSLQRTITFCISLGGDTDTIATMAGAIAGAYHGVEQMPLNWKLSIEGHKDAENWGEKLHELYNKRLETLTS
ncbi:ADP-ribosylhydrolase ARH3 [Bombina bombina]|uniref:ADP-ribosylhydrolase ARH3 n=1 Tax=Bombina bombina TaxID=8345 RepID=UPI00235A4E3E|nr:ADP-ribosylhydrolase ARH3 [Bombina bombina]